jgi:putative colanic acid biosynthesis UDP-glucose lipid carrier transferase
MKLSPVLKRSYLNSNESFHIALLRFADGFSGYALFVLIHALCGSTQAFTHQAGFVIFAFIVVFFHFHNCYRSFRFTSLQYELATIGYACLSLYIILLFLGYSVGILHRLPRKEVLTWMVLWPASVCGLRVFLRVFLRELRRRGYNIKKAVIVGCGEVGARLAGHILDNPWTGITLAGMFQESPSPGNPPLPPGVPVLGGLDAIAGQVAEHDVDMVYITLNGNGAGSIRSILGALEESKASVHYVPDIFYLDMIIGGDIVFFNEWPVIVLRDTPIRGISYLVKRLMDIVLSLTGLVVLSPLFALAAWAIRASGPGGVFFVQKRYGINGEPIFVYKFRTMTVTEAGESFTQATRRDPRITRVGAFLRRTSLDELPQLVNVLQGRMSLVGPRPHPVAMNQAYQNLVSGYRMRHRVKPGLTGLAQVNGFRGETDTLEKMEKRIAFDLKYIREWSLMLDLDILFKTLAVFLFQKTAY